MLRLEMIFIELYERNLNYTNRFASTLARWTGPGTSFDEPRVTFVDSNNNSRASDRYVEDGSYLRIKNIQLGYSFPDSLTEVYLMKSELMFRLRMH